jgi:hypothetical protein
MNTTQTQHRHVANYAHGYSLWIESDPPGYSPGTHGYIVRYGDAGIWEADGGYASVQLASEEGHEAILRLLAMIDSGQMVPPGASADQ